MIPDIPEILAMLNRGEITAAQAEAWIRSHVAASEDTGMLRDVFGGLAMLGLLARGDNSGRPAIAEYAYTMADAMMEARAK
jgi:hypothetical protein